MRLCFGPGKPCIEVVALLGLVDSLLRSIVANSGVNGAFKGDMSGCRPLDGVGGGSGPPSSIEEIDIDGRCGNGSSRVGAIPDP